MANFQGKQKQTWGVVFWGVVYKPWNISGFLKMTF